MLELQKDLLIHGRLIKEHVEYPEEIFGRMCPIFSCVIETDEPDLRHQLDTLFEQSAGPAGAFMDDQPSDMSQIRAESILQPQFGRGEDGGLCVQPGDHVTIGIRVEIICSDGINDYLRVTLRSIQSFIGWDCDEVDLDDVSSDEYEEFNF